MSNTMTVYFGSDKSSTKDHELKCYANNKDEIYICIDTHSFPESYICLDEHTAIKLSKELRKEIAKIKQNKGSNNG